MKKLVALAGTTLILAGSLFAQKKWDLRRCVEYALANNVSVQQNVVQERLGKLVYDQSRDARWPTLNFQGSLGEQFGRSIDPTTNLFTNNQITFNNMGVQSNVTLFNFFNIKNSIKANELNAEAAKMQTNKLKDDVALNVAAAYLQALLSYEQHNTARVQVQQTLEQLQVTRKRVDAGAVPELNAAELEAQLARDSANLVTTAANYELNLLRLKAVMNLDAAEPFDIDTPPVETIPVVPLRDLAPNIVFTIAVSNRPQQVANKLRLDALQKTTAANKAALYPSLNAFGGLQTAYSSQLERLPNGANVSRVVQTNSFVTVGPSQYFVNTPVNFPESYVDATPPKQWEYNFRQNIGISLTVPIYNGHQARAQYKRAQLNEHTQVLQMRADSLQLKQDIYQAYQSAYSAMETYQSRIKTLKTAEYSLSLGEKRYEVGLLPVLELITLQNNVLRARIEKLTAHYDYVFRVKILEFYKGLGISM
jgi:outer membrane protein